jgi:hypothetical protein
MRSHRVPSALLVVLSLTTWSLAQSPSALYTWDGTGDVRGWSKNFGANVATLSNGTAGELTISETGTAGEDIAISDNGNRLRERQSPNAAGGLDLTGLDFLEFDFGHNGAAPINVQFFVQASAPGTGDPGNPGYTYVALGPDLAVTPGTNTYQVLLSGLTPEQIVYVRTVGFNARDHIAVGNVTWTLGEVRSGGTPLLQRQLITHDTGTAEGGLQGAIVNFEQGAVVGSDGAQNQTGLSHNPAGSGSLRWTDRGGTTNATSGAAISWGNGTQWNGNTFNNRLADLSNYNFVTVRMSATDALNAGGMLSVQSFFQTNNFNFQAAGIMSLPIDGAFYDLTFPIDALVDMDLVDQHGINLGTHANDLVINVDSITFDVIPEPATGAVLGMAAVGCLGLKRRTRR